MTSIILDTHTLWSGPPPPPTPPLRPHYTIIPDPPFELTVEAAIEWSEEKGFGTPDGSYASGPHGTAIVLIYPGECINPSDLSLFNFKGNIYEILHFSSLPKGFSFIKMTAKAEDLIELAFSASSKDLSQMPRELEDICDRILSLGGRGETKERLRQTHPTKHKREKKKCE